VASKPPASVDKLSRIRTKTIEEILQMWASELEENVNTFTESARLVQQWDSQLMESFNSIKKLQEDLAIAQQQQSALNRLVETVKINQNDLSILIDQLEKQSTPTTQTSNALSADVLKREESFALAEEIDSALSTLMESLTGTVKSVNTYSERGLENRSDMLAIVRILNMHLQTLQWIDRETGELELRMSRALYKK
jgi:nuclear pore complex protein Nup62